MNLSRAIVTSSIVLFFVAAAPGISGTHGTKSGHATVSGNQVYWLDNGTIKCSIIFSNGDLVEDRLEGDSAWLNGHGAASSAFCTDADFRLIVMWTDWRAPGKQNNADNPVVFTKDDFMLTGGDVRSDSGGSADYVFLMKGKQSGLLLKLIYRLSPSKYYAKRNLAVCDSSGSGHFLEQSDGRWGRVYVGSPGHRGAARVRIEGSEEYVGLRSQTGRREGDEDLSIEKKGDFGQPIALRHARGGGFFGLEAPTSRNLATRDHAGSVRISCSEMVGKKIGKEWLEGEWVVGALTPDQYVKHWFMTYLDDVRVAPLRPFTLYNSWYDLRSADYPNVPESNVMNEKNVLRMVDLVRKNMVEKHAITMNAFVLDDGWDVYESDWVLRPKQFPNGLKPIADALRETHTCLGVWYGPTGGYSFRDKRIGWMKAHGYEVVGSAPNAEMLCLGGTKYGGLFQRRVVDMVANDGVGYFKWDGIQFSCSEPGHGHPVGIHSRNAILASLVEKCRAVRAKNPDVFLNITSGTWLSPWWVKYANTIWMDGADYAFANVPSLTPRDNAMTYRDFALYEDFKNKDLWFPIANLMTHGIIKGKLETISIGGEPLDRFTDDALLYVARGVSMYELYISPDILTDGEWNAVSQSIAWAKDRFTILSSTEMIGGNPTIGESYGYVHFKGNRGIIAARNPVVEPSALTVRLDPANGFDPTASSLVLEEVYPIRKVLPRLYAAGATIVLPLDSYETAIYEVYPLEEAGAPLIAGVRFEVVRANGTEYTVRTWPVCGDARVLNPELVKDAHRDGREVHVEALTQWSAPEPIAEAKVSGFVVNGKDVDLGLTIPPAVENGTVSILLTPSRETDVKESPSVAIRVDGKSVTPRVQKQKGYWAWFEVPVSAGTHAIKARLDAAKGEHWTGKVDAWLFCQQQDPTSEIELTTSREVHDRPMPPKPWSGTTTKKNVKLGEVVVTLK
jgi:hypothetical protein